MWEFIYLLRSYIKIIINSYMLKRVTIIIDMIRYIPNELQKKHRNENDACMWFFEYLKKKFINIQINKISIIQTVSFKVWTFRNQNNNTFRAFTITQYDMVWSKYYDKNLDLEVLTWKSQIFTRFEIMGNVL